MKQADRIHTDDTYKETAVHGTDDFPLKYYFEDVYLFDFHCIEWHWHSELELVLAKSGSFIAEIGSERFKVSLGDALLINSKVIHRFFTDEHAIIPNVVFSDRLLAEENSLVYKKFVKPIITSSVKFFHFKKNCPWQSDAINSIENLFGNIEEGNEIHTVRKLLELWELIYSNTDLKSERKDSAQKISSQTKLQILLDYIRENYMKQISLDELASVVSMGKSSVLNLFKKNLHLSPVDYLIRYRLSCAANLLKNTESGIEIIASSTGFSNIGYFCRKFKSVYEMTPTEYRNHRDIK